MQALNNEGSGVTKHRGIDGMQLRELESLMDDKVAWDALSRRDQQEKEAELRQQSKILANLILFVHYTSYVCNNFLLYEMSKHAVNHKCASHAFSW